MAAKQPRELLIAADDVLRFVCTNRAPYLALSSAQRSLEVLAGRGVTIAEADEPATSDEALSLTAADLTRASIDMKSVLTAALAGYGLSIGMEVGGSFSRLHGTSLPSDCEFYFLVNNAVPPYAIRAFSKARLCVILHVNDRLPTDYNTLSHGVGVHVMRLRNLSDLPGDHLRLIANSVAIVCAATPAPLLCEQASVLASAADAADPRLVEEYAQSQQDRLFEAAAAHILSRAVDGLIKLGGEFAGRAVPDGLLLDGFLTRKPEVMTYDCKSKKTDHYGLSPQDGDQQARYLRIQERLRDDGWRTGGVLLCTPSVVEEEFLEKTRKEFWRTFGDHGYRLLVIQASLLHRLQALMALEREGGLRLHYNPRRFWRALLRGELDNSLAEDEHTRLLGDRARLLRLVSREEIEIAWLNGFADHRLALPQAADAIRAGDRENIKASRIARPQILQLFFKALREGDGSTASVSKETGLSERAIEYLARCEPFHPRSPEESGKRGNGHLDDLRLAFGASSLSGSS